MNIQGQNLNQAQGTTVRESYMRQSYVFSGAMPTQQRSFISTSLVNDSYAFNDDLRKYITKLYLDQEYKIYLTIRRLILEKIFSLLLFFRLFKFKDLVTKYKC